MNVILSVLKFCCKALNFIRNLVMNFVFLLFVLALIVLVSLFSDGKKSQVLSGDQGALYLNLTGYLADNTEDMLSWQEEFQRLIMKRSRINILRLMWYKAFYLRKMMNEFVV